MRRIQGMAGINRGDELDGRHDRTLMQQLEHSMLRVGADATPCNRCRRPIDRLAIARHALAIALHLQLLEIGWQQPQPLIIGEQGARLAPHDTRIILVHESRDQRGVPGRIGQPEVPVHRRRALQQAFKRIPAKRQSSRETDGRPERIAPAYRLGKRQDARFVHAPFDRLVGIGGQRNHLAIGIIHPRLDKPVDRARGVQHGFGGGEGFGRNGDQCRFRIKARDRPLQRGPVNIGHDRHVIARTVAAQRVDDQVRPQRRPADADMQDMADRA